MGKKIFSCYLRFSWVNSNQFQWMHIRQFQNHQGLYFGQFRLCLLGHTCSHIYFTHGNVSQKVNFPTPYNFSSLHWRNFKHLFSKKATQKICLPCTTVQSNANESKALNPFPCQEKLQSRDACKII